MTSLGLDFNPDGTLKLVYNIGNPAIPNNPKKGDRFHHPTLDITYEFDGSRWNIVFSNEVSPGT